MSDIEVILPCLNEAAALPDLLTRCPSTVHPIVVDNGSTDGSSEVARRHGATVIACAERGYGAACHAGLMAARAPIVAVMDADGSLDPGELPRLVEPVRARTADLVLGVRRPISFRAWPVWLRWANRQLARDLTRRTGIAIADLGPMRVARRSDLLELAIADRRSGYPAETVVRAADAGWRIEQADVAYLPRVGRSKVSGSPLGAIRAARDLRAVIAR